MSNPSWYKPNHTNGNTNNTNNNNDTRNHDSAEARRMRFKQRYS